MASELSGTPVVLRAREVEIVDRRRPRSPSPVHLHERFLERERERSPAPPSMAIERKPRFVETRSPSPETMARIRDRDTVRRRERSPTPERGRRSTPPFFEDHDEYYDGVGDRAGPLVSQRDERRDDDDVEVAVRRRVESPRYTDDRALDRPRSQERKSRPYYSPSRSRRRSYYDDETIYLPSQPRPPQPQPSPQSQQTLVNPPPPAQIVINNYHHCADLTDDGSSDDTKVSDGRRRRRRQRSNRNGKRERGVDVKPVRQSSGTTEVPALAEEHITPGEQVISGAQAVLSKKRVNAVWDPSQNSDITIHLKLPHQEEGLDEQIEEFCRLRRLGDFASARRFFAQNLEDHHDNPYLLVQYAEMLLEQGDYITLSSLDGHVAFAPDNHHLRGREGALLRVYWKLMQLVRSMNSPRTYWGAVSVLPEALTTLHDAILSGEGPVGSTEIKVLAILLGLAWYDDADSDHLQPRWLRRQIARLFPEMFYRRLYADLLREGRVWDFHDIFLAQGGVEGFTTAIKSFVGPTDSRTPLSALLDDWKSPVGESDGSTLLALLDLLLSVSPTTLETRSNIHDIEEDTMALATQIATSVMKSHPELMDSHPFLYWMLRQSGNAILQGEQQQYILYNHPLSAPGILTAFQPNPIPGVYYHQGFELPEYTPAETENPGWRQAEAPAEYQAPAKLVLKQAKRFENYRLQSQALTNLILFSKSPTKLLDELCTLQKSVQGDIRQYAHTLGSTYLALDGDSSTDDLKLAIRGVFYESRSCLTMHEKWIKGLLLYSLERDTAEREKVLNIAFDNSRYLSKEVLALFDEKMPEIRQKRMEFLETNISSETERRQAEKGICSRQRLREALDLPELPELGMEEQPESNEKLAREEPNKLNTDEVLKRQDDVPVRGNEDEEYDSETSHQIRRERPRREHDQGEREWPEEQRVTHGRELEMEMKLQRLEHELEVVGMRHETEIARDRQRSLELRQEALEVAKEEVRELRWQEELDKLKARHKEEEELRQARTELEGLRREEQEQARRKQMQKELEELRREEEEYERRKQLEKDAIRDAAERSNHEDLMRELREVRAQMAEVKSAMKPQPQAAYFPDVGESPLGPIQLPGYPVWRRNHLRVPPSVIKGNYVPSSSSSSDSPSSEANDTGFRGTNPVNGEPSFLARKPHMPPRSLLILIPLVMALESVNAVLMSVALEFMVVLFLPFLHDQFCQGLGTRLASIDHFSGQFLKNSLDVAMLSMHVSVLVGLALDPTYLHQAFLTESHDVDDVVR
ncbi:hypothetical protein PG984_009736 [Apiospora sp. TS-2023a]